MSDWNTNYIDLLLFVDNNKRLPSENDDLSEWINEQKDLEIQNRLEKSKKDLLNLISIWKWNKFETNRIVPMFWIQNFEDLKKFVEKNRRMPKSSRSEIQESHLYNWVYQQKNCYEKNTLTPIMISMLESLDFWTWKKTEKNNVWHKMYSDLAKFVDQNKRYPHSKDGGKKIYRWYIMQKSFYLNGPLTEEKKLLLEKLPLWNVVHDYEWIKKYNIIIRMSTMHNRLPFSNSKSKIHNWLDEQQELYRMDKLEDYKIQQLELIKCWTWVPFRYYDEWSKMYKILTEFVENNGRFPTIREDPGMDKWIYDQKTNYHKGILPVDDIEYLEKINIWTWDLREEQILVNEKFSKKRKITDLTIGTPPKKIKIEEEYSFTEIDENDN